MAKHHTIKQQKLVQNVIVSDVDELRDQLMDLKGGLSCMIEILPEKSPLRAHLVRAYQALVIGKGEGTVAETLNQAFEVALSLAKAGKI